MLLGDAMRVLSLNSKINTYETRQSHHFSSGRSILRVARFLREQSPS